jgi:hypothetical protein
MKNIVFNSMESSNGGSSSEAGGYFVLFWCTKTDGAPKQARLTIKIKRVILFLDHFCCILVRKWVFVL